MQIIVQFHFFRSGDPCRSHGRCRLRHESHPSMRRGHSATPRQRRDGVRGNSGGKDVRLRALRWIQRRRKSHSYLVAELDFDESAL